MGAAPIPESLFFRGGSCVRYDWAADRADPGFPAAIATWGLAGDFLFGINAALSGDVLRVAHSTMGRRAEYPACEVAQRTQHRRRGRRASAHG